MVRPLSPIEGFSGATTSLRSTRATRAARTVVSSQPSGAAVGRSRRGRGNRKDEVKNNDAPAKKWTQVVRAPGPDIKFKVKMWVPVSDLTPEEKAVYDAGVAAKQNQQEAVKIATAAEAAGLAESEAAETSGTKMEEEMTPPPQKEQESITNPATSAALDSRSEQQQEQQQSSAGAAADGDAATEATMVVETNECATGQMTIDSDSTKIQTSAFEQTNTEVVIGGGGEDDIPGDDAVMMDAGTETEQHDPPQQAEKADDATELEDHSKLESEEAVTSAAPTTTEALEETNEEKRPAVNTTRTNDELNPSSSDTPEIKDKVDDIYDRNRQDPSEEPPAKKLRVE